MGKHLEIQQTKSLNIVESRTKLILLYLDVKESEESGYLAMAIFKRNISVTYVTDFI